MRQPRSAALLVVSLGAALALSGCAGSDDEPKKSPAGQPPASVVTSDDPSSPSSPTASAAATATASAPADIKDAFLPSSSVPGLNAKWEWQDGKAGSGVGKPFGVCAATDLTTLGAEKVRQQTYFPPDDSDDSAAQQVAEFVDAKSASQAWSVLDAWRSRCAKRIGLELGPKVGSQVPVRLPDGAVGRWYLVSWTPEGEETGRFEALGMVRQGALITVLRITNSGQDYDYPVGQEPMVKMVQLAGLRLFAGLGAEEQ